MLNIIENLKMDYIKEKKLEIKDMKVILKKDTDGYGIGYFKSYIKGNEGTWKEGKVSGNGIEYYPNGNKKYEGEFNENKYCRKGKLYEENG